MSIQVAHTARIVLYNLLEVNVNKFISLFVVVLSFALAACGATVDTPTPTPTTVAVAPPAGEAVPTSDSQPPKAINSVRPVIEVACERTSIISGFRFTLQSLSSMTLADIDQDVFKVQVEGEGELPLIAVKYTKSKGVSVNNLRLRRGTTDLDLAAYRISDVPADSTEGTINVSFEEKQSISGAGNVYTFHGTVDGAVSGQFITLSLVGAKNACSVTLTK